MIVCHSVGGTFHSPHLPLFLPPSPPLTFSLFLSPPPPLLSLSLHLIFLDGKDSKTPFSNDDFFCCCLTSKPRTPTHAPPPRGGVGSVYAPSAAQPSSVFLNFLNFHPLMNFIDLLPPPPTPLLCSSNCLDDNSPFHPQNLSETVQC